MAPEKYIALGSLCFYVMFVGEIITIYDFMIEPVREIEPAPKILQFISIGIAPAMILTGISFIMSRRIGSKPIGSMIIAGGAVLLVGMAFSYTLLDDIDESHLIPAVILVPPIFMVVSIPVMVVGVRLLRIKKQRPKKEYV